MPQIKIPAALAGGTGTDLIDVEGNTLEEVFENHAEAHGPELKESVVSEGEIREYINVFIDGEEADRLADSVDPDALIRVMPAASGGMFR